MLNKQAISIKEAIVFESSVVLCLEFTPLRSLLYLRSQIFKFHTQNISILVVCMYNIKRKTTTTTNKSSKKKEKAS